MVDFRKAILLLAVLVFATGIASAQQALSCTLNGGAPPLLRAEGVAEEVGQAFITCTGGMATPVNGTIPRINIRLFTSGPYITSRLVSIGSTTYSEATLLIDDPAPGPNQVLWTNANQANCVGGQYTPANCGSVFLASPVSGNPQAIEWRDIPFDPPMTTNVTRTLRFVNIRVNAAQFTGGNVTSLLPQAVNIYLSISGTFTLPITSPFLTVGYIQNGLTFSLRDTSSSRRSISSLELSQCGGSPSPDPNTPAFYARFTELFPTAFRVRGVPGPQDNLSTIYNTESMFYGPYGTLPAGQATQGTRLRLAFTGIPSGVDIWVPQTLGTSPNFTLQLVPLGTDNSTADPSATAPSGWTNVAKVGLTGGAGSAVYEVLIVNSGAVDNFDIPVYLRFPSTGLPALGSGSVFGSYAPLSTTDLASSTAPVPRFYQNPAATIPITIAACETRLLFPFVTSLPGFDTGIAISNTSQDPFGTAGQSGACTLFFYGTPSNSSQTSATIPPGGQLLMTLSNGNSAQNLNPVVGFNGYMIARCNFQYAHGYAFISDPGANKFAQGYLALILGDGKLTTRFGSSASEALNQ